MSETSKHVWAVIAAIIALAAAFGAGYALYERYMLLPEFMDISGNLINSVIVGIVTFAAVFMVLYKGVHPY